MNLIEQMMQESTSLNKKKIESKKSFKKLKEGVPAGYEYDTCPECGSDDIDMTYQDEPIEYIPKEVIDKFVCNSCGCKFQTTYSLTDIKILSDGE